MRATVVFLLALFAGSAAASDLHVDAPSAKAPGTAVVRITGDPGRPYALFYSPIEEYFEFPDGTFLFVDPTAQLAAGLEITGVLDAAGEAFYTYPVKARQAGTKVTFQALSAEPFLQVSNLCRVTLQKPNTFAMAVGQEGSPTFMGDLFPMSNGRLLSVGGSGSMIEAYDPCLQNLEAVGWMDPAYPHAARAMLANGRVLIAGGLAADGSAVASAVVFDPKFGDALSVGPMLSPRAGAAAAVLADGRVLVVGGLSSSDLTNAAAFAGGLLASTEIFDPSSGSFSPGPSMPEAKAFATATRLSSGAVLVAGGFTAKAGAPDVSKSACVIDSGVASSGPLLPMPTRRVFHSATLLPDDSVLLAGGMRHQEKLGDLTQPSLVPQLNSAVYSASSGAIVEGPKLLARRGLHAATLLGSSVFLVGGVSGPTSLSFVLAAAAPATARPGSELVAVGQLSRRGPGMRVGRAGASSAVSSMDGRVIVVGGGPLKPSLYQP